MFSVKWDHFVKAQSNNRLKFSQDITASDTQEKNVPGLKHPITGQIINLERFLRIYQILYFASNAFIIYTYVQMTCIPNGPITSFNGYV